MLVAEERGPLGPQPEVAQGLVELRASLLAFGPRLRGGVLQGVPARDEVLQVLAAPLQPVEQSLIDLAPLDFVFEPFDGQVGLLAGVFQVWIFAAWIARRGRRGLAIKTARTGSAPFGRIAHGLRALASATATRLLRGVTGLASLLLAGLLRVSARLGIALLVGLRLIGGLIAFGLLIVRLASAGLIAAGLRLRAVAGLLLRVALPSGLVGWGLSAGLAACFAAAGLFALAAPFFGLGVLPRAAGAGHVRFLASARFAATFAIAATLALGVGIALAVGGRVGVATVLRGVARGIVTTGFLIARTIGVLSRGVRFVATGRARAPRALRGVGVLAIGAGLVAETLLGTGLLTGLLDVIVRLSAIAGLRLLRRTTGIPSTRARGLITLALLTTRFSSLACAGLLPLAGFVAGRARLATGLRVLLTSLLAARLLPGLFFTAGLLTTWLALLPLLALLVLSLLPNTLLTLARGLIPLATLRGLLFLTGLRFALPGLFLIARFLTGLLLILAGLHPGCF